MTQLKKAKIERILDQSLAEAFPAVDPNLKPFGSLVLVQIKRAATKTKSGILLQTETVETEFDNTRVAKIVDLGPLCFHNRETQKLWPEGMWVKPGDYVRIPQYGGDRWRVHYDTIKNPSGSDEKLYAEFALIEDLNLKGLVTGDPMDTPAFL